MATHEKPVPGSKTQAPRGPSALMLVIGLVCLVTLFVIGLMPRLVRKDKLGREAHDAAVAQPELQVTGPLPEKADDLVLPGNTEAIEDATIGARTTGYVTKRLVDIGSHVKAGQLLAVIQSPDVDAQMYQAAAQSAQSQAQVEQARADVYNKQATVAQSQSGVRQAQAAVETQRANLADAQAKLQNLITAVAGAEANFKLAQHNVNIKQSALQQATTSRNLAKVTLDRYQALYKQGFVAAQEVDQYLASYNNSVSAVASAQSDVSAAESAADAAQQAVRGAQANVNSGRAEVNAARKNVDAASATVEANRSAVVAARANVRGSQSTVVANQFAQRASQENTKHFKVLASFENVTAPFSGVITARNIDVGSLVNSGSGAGGGSSTVNTSLTGSASTGTSAASTTPSGGLFGLARSDILRIYVSVPAVYAREMHAGMPVKVDFDREFPGRIFAGKVARVSGALDASTRTLLTEIHIDNSKGEILPGMFGQVHFALRPEHGAVEVASSAVMYDALGTRVVLVQPDNTLHFVPVTVGRDFGQVLEILSGLNGNEKIVYSPSDDLIEGEKIDPVPAPPIGEYGTQTPPPPGGGAPGAHGRGAGAPR